MQRHQVVNRAFRFLPQRWERDDCFPPAKTLPSEVPYVVVASDGYALYVFAGLVIVLLLLPKVFAAKPKEQQEKTANVRPVETRRPSRCNMIKLQQRFAQQPAWRRSIAIRLYPCWQGRRFFVLPKLLWLMANAINRYVHPDYAQVAHRNRHQ